MSTIAQKKSKPNYNAFIVIVMAPLAIAAIAVFVLAANDGFTSMEIAMKSAVLVAVGFGAITIAMGGASIWAYKNRNWVGVIFLAAALVFGLLAFMSFRTLLIQGATFFGL